MANEATNLQTSLGIQSKDQKQMEMAGAVTRLILNQVIGEAKQRASIRDAAMAPSSPIGGGESSPTNG